MHPLKCKYSVKNRTHLSKLIVLNRVQNKRWQALTIKDLPPNIYTISELLVIFQVCLSSRNTCDRHTEW